MEIIQTELRTGELRIEYKGLKVQCWANSTRRGWDLYILRGGQRRYNTPLVGIEVRTFKERTMMTKWIKSNFR